MRNLDEIIFKLMKQKGTGRRTAAEGSSHHEIRIWIDDYNDIFSDFDPRDYSERNISDDFLHELKKVANENDDSVKSLRLLLDQKLRDRKMEVIVVDRLHVVFSENFHRYMEKRKSHRYRSIVFLISGLLMILGASYFSYLRTEYPLMHIPLVVLEPAGWFFTWTALELMFRSGKKSMPDLVFYAKFGKTKIVFENI